MKLLFASLTRCVKEKGTCKENQQIINENLVWEPGEWEYGGLTIDRIVGVYKESVKILLIELK